MIYTPINFVGITGTPQEGLDVAHLDSADLWCSGNAKAVVDEGNELIILRGCLIISAKITTKVKAAGSLLTLRKGAIVAIDCNDDGLIVYCLGDTHKNSVHASTPAGCAGLSVGDDLAFAKNKYLLLQKLLAKNVGQRCLQLHESESGCMATAEFSLVGLSSQCTEVNRLLRSHERLEKHLSADVIKATASLMQVTSRRAAYQKPQSAVSMLLM